MLTIDKKYNIIIILSIIFFERLIKMGKLLVGWSEVSITPDKKISLAGQFVERISEYVETPITATALAIESDGVQMVMCSCDLVSIAKSLVKDVRERIAGKSDLNPENIIISATHVHTGPLYAREDGVDRGTTGVLNRFLPEDKQYKPKVVAKGDDVMKNDEMSVFLADRIAEVILKAWENRKAGKFAQGFGRAAVGMNRRVCFSDGSAKMWGDTNSATFTHLEAGNDSGIEILFFYDENKKLTGVVANIACPAQVLEHRHFVSSDYWGKIKILLREKFGEDLFVLGLTSPAGDQCPRDLVRWVNPILPIDDPNIDRPDYIERKADPSMFEIEGTWKIGKRVSREIIDAYEEVTEIFDEALLKHEALTVDLPLRRVTPKEYDEAVLAMKEYAKGAEGNADFKDNAMMYVHAGAIKRYEVQHTVDICPIEVHIARLGNVAFATNPYELFLDYGNQMRARSRAQQTILIQHACETGGYLPTKEAEAGAHYSAYVSSGTVGSEGGEMLVRKSVEEINKMFRE